MLLNSSHTHCGPVIDDMLAVAYDLTPQQWGDIDEYTAELTVKIIGAIGGALKQMRPVTLTFGHARPTDFAANRRLVLNPNGPVDHDVPFLRVSDSGGKALALVFGYACHTTTIGAEHCRFDGDYAGYAQAALQDPTRGAIAFFVTGCGADANPKPRGASEQAQQERNKACGCDRRHLCIRSTNSWPPAYCLRDC